MVRRAPARKTRTGPDERSGPVLRSRAACDERHYALQPSRPLQGGALAEIFLDDLLGPSDPEEAGGQDQSAEPLPSPAPELSSGELEEYAGDWVSEELDTHYVLTVVDGKLVAQHYRQGTID